MNCRRTLDSRWTRIFLWSVVLFGALPYLLQKLHWTQALSEGIYVGTGIAVLWYTVETQGMRREMVRQNDLAVAPLLVFTIVDDQLLLRNIGRGPALSIKVADVEVPAEVVTGLLVFETNDTLTPDDDLMEVHTYYHPTLPTAANRLDGVNFIASLKPASPDTYRVTVHFEDINGGARDSVAQLGNGGVRLLSHSTPRSEGKR